MITQGNDLKIGIPTNRAAKHGGPVGPLILDWQQRGRQTYIAGGTGSGKSKLVEHFVRQDILNWPKTQCGVLVIDPHGSLFDSLMRWIAANDFKRWPIIPIDLRRNDMVVSYNLLRRRSDGGDPAVAVANFARAIAHSWGAGDLNETPRLAKWLRTILSTLYERDCTLAEALHLIRSPELRQQLTSGIEDTFARTVWESAAQLRPGDFQEEVSSTMNRLMKFLSTQVIRASLCQTEPSLDLGRVLEKGSIVLVSLATAGGRIDEEDAATFGSVLLSDLWTAAKARGKSDECSNGVRPFYVYVDELQEFVTPVMAKTLDQARGFGLHMTLAHQFPSQLLARGELGKLAWHSVMANCRNKIVFSVEHPEDLPQLALWLYRHRIDTEQVKFQGYSTKVMGHQMIDVESTSESVMESEGGGVGHSETSSYGRGGGMSHSTGRSTSIGSGSGSSIADGTSQLDAGDDWVLNDGPQTNSHVESESESKSNSDTNSESWAENESWNESFGSSDSSNRSWATGISRGRTISPMLLPMMGQEALPPMFRGVEEQLFRFTQYLAGQRDRHCVARLANSRIPVRMVTFDVPEARTTRGWMERWCRSALERIPFALPMVEALRRIDMRSVELAGRFLKATVLAEPQFTRRRISSHLVDDLPSD